MKKTCLALILTALAVLAPPAFGACGYECRPSGRCEASGDPSQGCIQVAGNLCLDDWCGGTGDLSVESKKALSEAFEGRDEVLLEKMTEKLGPFRLVGPDWTWGKKPVQTLVCLNYASNDGKGHLCTPVKGYDSSSKPINCQVVQRGSEAMESATGESFILFPDWIFWEQSASGGGGGGAWGGCNPGSGIYWSEPCFYSGCANPGTTQCRKYCKEDGQWSNTYCSGCPCS